MSSIPVTTTPLTKFIRTGEGVLVFAFNGALLVVPIVSGALSAEQAFQWAAIINGVTVVSRTGLKIVSALESGSSAGAPPPPVPYPESAGPVATGDADLAPAAPAADLEPADSPHMPIEPDVSDADEFGSVPPPVPGPPMTAAAEVSLAPAESAANGQPATAGWA
jgi:hypothetical protein